METPEKAIVVIQSIKRVQKKKHSYFENIFIFEMLNIEIRLYRERLTGITWLHKQKFCTLLSRKIYSRYSIIKYQITMSSNQEYILEFLFLLSFITF